MKEEDDQICFVKGHASCWVDDNFEAGRPLKWGCAEVCWIGEDFGRWEGDSSSKWPNFW